LLRAGWRGFVAILEVLFEGVADGFFPVFGAAGVGELVLGDLDGLEESLGEVGESPSGFGLDVALDDGWEEATEGVAEVAGGEVLARKEIGYVVAEFVGGLGLSFFAGVESAEIEMVRGMWTTLRGSG
jgi:hypothetical protein